MRLSGDYESAPGAPALSWRAAGGQFAAWLAANLAAERERWPLFLPVAMGAGIGIYFWLHSEPPLWLGPVLAFAALALTLIVWRRPRPLLAAAALLALCLGLRRRRAAGALGGIPRSAAQHLRHAGRPRPCGRSTAGRRAHPDRAVQPRRSES
jgi:competence protein ComEC